MKRILIESRTEVIWQCIGFAQRSTLLCDWTRNFAPGSKPAECIFKSNRGTQLKSSLSKNMNYDEVRGLLFASLDHHQTSKDQRIVHEL